MMKLAMASAVALAALGGAAHAQGYVNGGIQYLEDSEIWSGLVRGGADIGPNFGLEAEGAMGFKSGTPVAGTSVKLKHLLGGFARLRAPLGPNVEGFVRGGYYTARMSATTAGVTVSGSDDDFAGGAGVQFNMGANSGIRIDYTNYGFSGSGHSGSLAYVMRF